MYFIDPDGMEAYDFKNGDLGFEEAFNALKSESKTWEENKDENGES